MRPESNTPPVYDVVVIGGGPAGSAAARVLALWGHRVLVLNRPRESGRSLAESIPPSARKAFDAISVLDAIEHAGFAANRGNVVWWGGSEERQEGFGGDGKDAAGFFVFRPDLDALLIARAEAAGAIVQTAVVADVQLDADGGVGVDYLDSGGRTSVRAHYALDCSGRAGVIARRGFRVREPHHRMQALLGLWRGASGSTSAAQDRTLVETYGDGWAWSLPLAPDQRHVAVMVDGVTSRVARRATIADTYLAELAKTRHLAAIVADGTLEQAWACDASMYSSTTFAGDRFLLAGDAGACLDPLSSFGVKKAIASAWLAAVAVHTVLLDPARRDVAFTFYSARERAIHSADRARTRDFARRAFEHHGSDFWRIRSREVALDDAPSISLEDTLLQSSAVKAAYDRLRTAALLEVRWNGALPRVERPIVRGNEIVLEAALPIAATPVRYVNGVDLFALGTVAVRHRHVPDAYREYCDTIGAVSLPNFLSILSLLIAERVLELR